MTARDCIGVLLFLGGIAAAIYCGFWWAFLGGIFDVVAAVRAEELSKTALLWGVAKVLFAGPVGWLSGMAFWVTGAVVSDKIKMVKR
jgi:hypothetical protein